ncbi:TetR/AcrR family transcriptional regulator [Actinoplanes sp. NPDC020271]|uniref:TetR/AcrR family transcriptional regulator n=1 Tax=Actinoplanes sp. NPDC020271 TaxID=3363896 RepID=UPI0037AF2CFB
MLDQALLPATVSRLDGLSLSQVADALGVSKSGLFAHWRSEEALRLAVIDRAREQWTERVIRPALAEPTGALDRSWARDRRCSAAGSDHLRVRREPPRRGFVALLTAYGKSVLGVVIRHRTHPGPQPG